MLGALRQNISYGIRTLFKSKGFATALRYV